MRIVPFKCASLAGNRADNGKVTPFRCVAAGILSGWVTGWARRSSRAVPRKRLADHRIGLELDDAARAFLVERGYDPTYGARPLKRAITRYPETPLAREIIDGRIPDGSVVDVAVDGDRLTFTPTMAAEPVTDDSVEVIKGEVVDTE